MPGKRKIAGLFFLQPETKSQVSPSSVEFLVYRFVVQCEFILLYVKIECTKTTIFNQTVFNGSHYKYTKSLNTNNSTNRSKIN